MIYKIIFFNFIKEDNFVLNNFDDNEIATMINFLCSD